MKPGEGVFDRIEQSFDLLFGSMRNFTQLVGPIFLYKLIIGIFLWNFVSFVLLGSFDVGNTEQLFSPYFMVIFFLIIVGFLLYITFFIGVLLATIKTIKDIFEGKNINIKNNIKYGFDRIIASFNTYWYIFAYIVLWPFLFISLGGILIILSYILGITDLNKYGLYLMGFGFGFLLFFMIYRGIKTKFSLVSAVNYDSYTKDNFEKSVIITNNNWWRIIGNYFLIGLIISIIGSIVGAFFSFFSTSIFDIIDYKKIFADYYSNNINQESINNIITNIKTFYNTFYLNNFIVSIFNSFYENFIFVFSLVFTFIFYKRLEIEYGGLDKEHNQVNNGNEKKEIELLNCTHKSVVNKKTLFL